MFVSVQYLRALAAILVLFHHALHKQQQLSGQGGRGWEFGTSGVDLFFIISGFIMCYVTARRETMPQTFLWARIKRIIPLYWTLSFMALAVYLVNPNMVNSSSGPTTIINSFTLIPNGSNFLISNGWTLSFEFLFYLVFAAALWLGPKQQEWRLGIISLVLSTLVILGSIFHPSYVLLDFLTDPDLLEFMMGIAAYLYIKRTTHNNLLNVLLILMGIGLLVPSMLGHEATNHVLKYGVPYTLLFAGFVSLEKLVRQYENSGVSRLLKTIGDASYSIYLSHPFVLVGAGLIIKKLHLPPLLVFPVLITIALGAGYLCFTVLESSLSRLVNSSDKNLRFLRASTSRT